MSQTVHDEMDLQARISITSRQATEAFNREHPELAAEQERIGEYWEVRLRARLAMLINHLSRSPQHLMVWHADDERIDEDVRYEMRMLNDTLLRGLFCPSNEGTRPLLEAALTRGLRGR